MTPERKARSQRTAPPAWPHAIEGRRAVICGVRTRRLRTDAFCPDRGCGTYHPPWQGLNRLSQLRMVESTSLVQPGHQLWRPGGLVMSRDRCARAMTATRHAESSNDDRGCLLPTFCATDTDMSERSYVSTVLNVLHDPRLSAPSRELLAQFAKAFGRPLTHDELRRLMFRAGQRFAADHPLLAGGSMHDHAVNLNAHWATIQWGRLQLVDARDGARRTHAVCNSNSWERRHSPARWRFSKAVARRGSMRWAPQR